MAKNDIFYKILFAIEIALLPLILAADILLPSWIISLFIACILIVKIWLKLFKEKEKLSHTIINSISSISTISVLVIFFTVKNYIELYLCILVVVFVVLANVLQIYLHNKTLPETISAVDFCYVLFEISFLIGLIILSFTELPLNIALFAILLTAVVLAGYKIYYTFRYTNLINKLKDVFRRK